MKKSLFIITICMVSTYFGILSASDWKIITYGIGERNEVDPESSTPKYLYRIASLEEWQKSQGQQQIETSPLDENFIHLATKDQISQIVKKFWNKKDFVILKLDSEKLKGRLVYETNPGGTTYYYHLYEGKIPLDAVIDASVVHNR